MSRQDHPTLETLLELTAGELPAAEADRAREHLRGCADCSARWQELHELSEPPDAAAVAAGPEHRAAAWGELGRVLPLGPAAAETAPAFRPAAPGRAPRWAPGPWLAAAALAAAAGFLFWLAPRPGPAPAPALALAASTQIIPVDFSTLGSLPEPKPANCPPPGGFFVIVLGGFGASHEASGKVYEVDLRGPRASLTATAGVNRFGDIELVVGRSALTNGDYRIRVRNPRAENELVEEYRLTIRCP